MDTTSDVEHRTISGQFYSLFHTVSYRVHYRRLSTMNLYVPAIPHLREQCLNHKHVHHAMRAVLT
jgi:hypothetical protein